MKAINLFFFVFLCSLGSCLPNDSVEIHDLDNTLSKSDEALTFCKKNNFNTDYCIMIDMSLHSGKNRFYVWSMKNKAAIDSGLVAHGTCKQASKDNLTLSSVSNTNNSHCSSIGKYKIGNRAYSNWGINIKYWLHGLESTNNNAESRVVVLHSWEAVNEIETYPMSSPEGWGCPAVSNGFMRRLDTRLQNSDKPVLMWIYL